jgi:ABC-2 type transport system ATP-binding protein
MARTTTPDHPRPATRAAIEAIGLEKTYKAGRAPGSPKEDVRALDGVTFAVEPGVVFALLGPNGAGKSTTVKILTTLSRADGGSASVAGLDVRREPAKVRMAIGCVNQRSGLDPMLTGRENLLLQGQLYGHTGRALEQTADALLSGFGLSAAADRLTKTYSGGMQRKLDVALGLVHRPQVLFLDEPTTGLDPEARAEMWAEITRLTREEGLTILLTTHYLEEADQLAAELAIVDRGRVVVTGTPDQLKGELHGDTVGVELSADTAVVDLERASAALIGLSGITDVVHEGRTFHARASSGAAAVPAVLNALEDRGLTVASVTVARPSLDDVYLRYAGRSYAATAPASSTPEPVLEGASS